jgi:F420-dependent oxidoreductase-like protein
LECGDLSPLLRQLLQQYGLHAFFFSITAAGKSKAATSRRTPNCSFAEAQYMRLGLNLGYWGADARDHVALAREAENLGFHSLWTAEAYGSDSVTPLVWLAAKTERIKVGTAVMQMPARTPAMTAMTAATVDLLTGGRLLLGLGVSGPQVVEGWHGVPYGKPIGRTREYVEIVRSVLARRGPVEHHGEHYDIPLRGGTGLGKPLKLIIHPLRESIPIYLAAIGPKNISLAAEIADGWLAIFFSPERMGVFRESLDEGFAKAGRDGSDFDIAPTVAIHLGSDLRACRDVVKPALALYIGGMGAREKNFYFNLACRYGYEEAAMQIQDLFLGGRKQEAVLKVPDALVDEVALCGPRERIGERLEIWRKSGITTLICGASSIEALRVMAELAL